MIKKYSNFIGESLEFLLESDVVYSDTLRKVLNSIDNPISKTLLGIENSDLPVRSNYFDIVKDKNDTLSFLADRRAQEILKDKETKELVNFRGDGGWLTHNIKENGSLFDALGYTPVDTEPYKPQSTDIGEVMKKVTSPTSGKTYAWVKFPNGEGVYNVQKLRPANDTAAQLWGRGRQEMGVGRAMRALLLTTGGKFLDKDIESFVNLYKSAIDKLNDKFSHFEVVRGEMIAHWYDSSNYVKGGGTLNSSCMSNVDEDYFDIYVSNPERIGLVIYKNPEDDTKILGRSLLWKTNDDKMFMDRIYTLNDSDVQLFRQYAKESGWYSKSSNGSSSQGDCIAPDGSNVRLDLIVNIKKGYYEKYPYLDTLKFWSPGVGIINNLSGEYTLEDTEGDYNRCETCGGEGRHDCYECDSSGEVECHTCDGDGEVDCDSCDDATGTVTCETCGGTGKDDEDNDCSDCSGEGLVDCDDCEGSGKKSCDRCDGEGTTECSNCDGDGRVDCQDC